MKYNENNLTDMSILCYYAYSDLYRGDKTKRRELLDVLCGCPTSIEYHGIVYQTVKIGTQCWMKENLRTTKYKDGTHIKGIFGVTEDWETTVGAYSIYPHELVDGINSDEEMIKAYGALYNWYAVNDSRGLCPPGWHVPSYDEWRTIRDYLGLHLLAGGKMKSTRTAPDPHPRWDAPNTGATNESGWSGLPGGWRFGNFSSLGESGFFWSSTEIDNDRARRIGLYYNEAGFSWGGPNKYQGTSIRCVKD